MSYMWFAAAAISASTFLIIGSLVSRCRPSVRMASTSFLLSLNCIGPFPIGFDILARDACPSTVQIERHDWDISKILSPFWNVTEILTAELVGTIRGAPVAALSHR